MRCRQLAALFCPAERRLQWEARCHAAYRQHGMMPAFAGMMSCRQLTALYLAAEFGGENGRAIARHEIGGGGVAASPTGCRKGRLEASLPTAGQSAGGISAPPVGGTAAWGAGLRTPIGVLCEPPGRAARGMVPLGMVPPIGGTVPEGGLCRRRIRRRTRVAGLIWSAYGPTVPSRPDMVGLWADGSRPAVPARRGSARHSGPAGTGIGSGGSKTRPGAVVPGWPSEPWPVCRHTTHQGYAPGPPPGGKGCGVLRLVIPGGRPYLPSGILRIWRNSKIPDGLSPAASH